MQQDEKPDMTAIILIDPPFKDQVKDKEEFVTTMQFNFKENKILKNFGMVIHRNNQILPFYASVNRHILPNDDVEYFVFGGAYITDEGLLSSGLCYKLKLSTYFDTVAIQYECYYDNNESEDSVLPELAIARHNHRTFEIKVDGEEYAYLVVGGIQITKESHVVLNSCELFRRKNKKTNKLDWTKAPDLSTARAGFCGFTLGQRVYVFGGYKLDQTGKSTPNVITQAEYYDLDAEKWVLQKIKWKLGLFGTTGCLCLPINDHQVLIFGGSNGERISDQVAVFNSNKLSVEPLKVKLSVPRAGAKGKIMRGLKMKVVQRTQDEEFVTYEDRDLIAVFMGAVDDLSVDVFWVKDWNTLEMELMKKDDLTGILGDDVNGKYSFFNVDNLRAWNLATQAYPVLIY